MKKLYFVLVYCFIVILFFTCEGCKERGTKNNPILLYDSSDNGEIYYKEDKGSSGILNVIAVHKIIKERDSVIDSLNKIIDELISPSPTATLPYVPDVQESSDAPIKKSNYDKEEKLVVYYLKLHDEMTTRLICHTEISGDSQNAADELLSKVCSYDAFKWDLYQADKFFDDLLKEQCKCKPK